VPTPVGPAPRDPNDPDFWDWGDDEPGRRAFSRNGGHDDRDLHARLQRRRRRIRLVALIVVVVVFAALLAASL
jgi:uncharacterized protein involved in exopolysaccharide biosynthesis